MPEFPVSRDVEYELVRLLRRSRVRGMQLVTQVHPGLDYASYLLLVAIGETTVPDRAGVRGSELADSFGVHKSTISRGLSTLEGLGLVERVPDPTDGRARLVALSADAAVKMEQVRKQRHERLATAIESWDGDDLGVLARLLERLNTALESD